MGVQSLGPIKKLQAKKNSVAQGALTANTYATVLSVTGAGIFNYLIFVPITNRSINFRISIDGTVVSTTVSTSTTGGSNYFFNTDNNMITTTLSNVVFFGGLYFSKSLLIEIQSTTNASASDMQTDVYYQLEV